MDLLETVLRSAGAEEFIETFRNENIDAATLPLLTENDLEVIGIDNSDTRKAILKNSSTLQIPHEKKCNLTMTKEYVDLVFNQISHQLYLHHASLSCALTRKDVVVCNMKLHKGSQCLLKCITSLEQELNRFERKFAVVRKGKSAKKRKAVCAILGVTAVVLLIVGKLL